MSKTVSKIGGFVIGAVLIGIGIATGSVGLIIQGGAMIVTQAIVDLTMPKVPARQASEQSIQLGETPRVMQIGETFTAGSLVDGFNYGGKYGTDWECLVIRLADHKCEGLTGFYVNDEYNPYAGDGLVERYDDQLEIYFRSDTSTQTITSRVTDNGPGWTAADVGESGCDVVVCYKADKPDDKHPGWPGGRPRFGFVIKGALCYDPRLDDTVPGGSGPHRDDDPATWEWSENPIICRYKWVRGVYANDEVSDQSKILVGRGLTAEEAPPENIIAAANLCEEDLGAAPPYEFHPTDITDMARVSFSPGYARLVFGQAQRLEVWNVAARQRIVNRDIGRVIGASPTGAGVSETYGLSGWFEFNPGLIVMSATGTVTGIVELPFWSTGIQVIGGIAYLLPTGTGVGYYSGGSTFEVSSPGFGASQYVADDDGNVWAVGGGSTVHLYCITGPRAGDSTSFASPLGSSDRPAAVFTSAGELAIRQGTGMFLMDLATYSIGTVAAGIVGNGALDASYSIRSASVGASTVWVGFREVDLTTLTVLRTVAVSSWGLTTVGMQSPIYDPVNHALVTMKGSDLYWLFLDRNASRYRVSGPIYSNQDFIDVEGMFATAVAGNVITHEGSVELEPAQAKSVVATITDDDILVGGQTSWNNGFLSESSAEWVNSVVGRYVEPSVQWQDHAAPIVRDTDDIIADGKPREASVTMRLVRDLSQAQRVAEINRRLGRIWGRALVKLGPRFCELEEGDWISWQSDRYFAGGTKTFRIDAYSIDEKWQIQLTLREISGDVYADDGDFASDGTAITPTIPPPDIGAPDGADWTLTATTLTSSGASVPALSLTGELPADESAEAIIVEYWKDDGLIDPVANSDDPSWLMVGRYAPSTTSVNVTGLVGGATYYVAVSYIVSGITGDRLVLGPATVADLDVSGQVQPIVDALPWKAPVRVATTANGTLASAFENGDTIDGVTLATGDRILIKNQSTGSQNGIYTVNASGAPTRSVDADTGAELVGATVRVTEGTANAGTQWSCTTAAPITLGSTSIVFASLSSVLSLVRPVAFFFTTAPTASEKFGPYPAVDAFTLPANLSGAQVAVGTNPTATFAIDVQRALAASPTSFSTIGTISIATSGAVTLTTVSGTSKSIAAGDIIRFVMPSSPDATIADVGVNLKGTI